MDTLGSLWGRGECQGSTLGGFWCPMWFPADTKSIKFDVFFDMVAQYGRRHHGSYVLRHLGPAAESHMRLKCCK